MKWITAIKWATPIWIVAVGAAGATMFLTGFSTEVSTAEAFKRLALFTTVALPLLAFTVKATSSDVRRFRATFFKER